MSDPTIEKLAEEVLRRYENAKDWRQPPNDWKDANRTRIYMRKACEVAPALARAVLELTEANRMLVEALEKVAQKAEDAEGYDRLLPILAKVARAALAAQPASGETG